MQLELLVIGFDPNPSLKEYVTQRFRLAFDRFERCLERITVQLTDLNGPRKGPDKRCHMTAEFRGGGKVTIRDTRKDERAAVYHAASRLRYVIGKRLAITRARRRFQANKKSD